jgi:hypothetical protein
MKAHQPDHDGTMITSRFLTAKSCRESTKPRSRERHTRRPPATSASEAEGQ